MYLNMSINSSSFVDLSLLPPQLLPSILPHMSICFKYATSIVVFSAFSFANVLLLPLLCLTLHLGYQEWRKQGSNSTSATSHTDLFVYHSIVMQLIVYVGFTCYFCGGYTDQSDMTLAGLNIWSTITHGQALFHILTCVERYMAVVHPITYRNLRQTDGAIIVNISIGCVWLVSFGWLAVCYFTNSTVYMILYCCDLAFFLTVISVCSIYVLCALKRPGPREVVGNKAQVDQSKQRAFRTIMAIMGVLLIRFGWNLISFLLNNAKILSPTTSCVVVLSAFWVDLPSSLVLPLLFLHRRGKLRCCKQKPESE